jgi:triosephosphate isomerase
MHWESEGAYTGEVSGPMLLTAGCTHVILGHSERRTLFGETDETVNHKVLSARALGLIPILCVGETLAEREGGRAEAAVVRQVRAALTGVSVSAPGELIVAYEPVWAIGTGRVAKPEDAQAMHEVIRETLARVLGSELAAEVRVQYGGSVKPDNAARLLAQRDIDGALVGGASLDAGSFLGIVRCMDC